ncbi:MAG: UbiX family flavin prenyltransferase [Candidatus Odinarchaeota archaeon]
MILIGITGASGILIADRLLQVLKTQNIETGLIISKSAKQVILTETSLKLSDLEQLASKNYDVDDLTAPPSSGSHKIDAMIIVPCTMKTLAAIAHGFSDNLITRAADVTIKEKRKLILIVRESPLSPIHLENMLKLAKLGVVIAPPVPSYYIKPESVDELIDHTVGRILDQIGIESKIKRWGM